MSFWNKYLALAISLLLFITASAQDHYTDSLARVDSTLKFQDINGNGFNWKGGRFVNVLRAPHGLPNLSSKDSGAIAWYNKMFWQFSDAGTWDTLSGNGSGAVMPTKVYVKGRLLTVDTTTNPGFQTLGTNELDGLKSGGLVTGAGGLSVGVTVAEYVKNFDEYISPEIVLTAVADPSLPRKYIVVVDTTGVASLIAGTPATNPIEPQINPASQIRITGFDVPAGATNLNINTIVIYDETGGTEYTPSTSGTITANASDVANPEHGTKDYFISSYADGAKIIFTKSSGQDTVFTNSIFKGFVWLNNPFTGRQLQLQLFLAGVPVTANISLNTYFNPLDTLQYQILGVPYFAFGTSGNIIYDQKVYTLRGNDLSGASGFYLDFLQLQTGITNNTSGRGVLSIVKNAAGDTTITTLQDGTVFKVFDRGSNLSLTTSGSGAATLVSNILNIPTPSIPAQFNPIAGTNVTISGSYPNITFNATSSGITALTGDVTASGTGSVVATLARQLSPTAVKTANYSAAINDFVPCDNTSASFTVTLPNAPADKSVIEVKTVIQSGTNTVTISRSGSDVFNKTGGTTSLTISYLNEAFWLQYKASSGIWYVLAHEVPIGAISASVDTTTAITGLTTLYTLGRTNVRKYGAVGDGTTNDQTAITNAIAATPVGGVLYFPEGTYLVSTTVSVNKAITIQGTGQSRIKVTGNISAFTLNSNNVNIDFLNFHGSGNGGANTSQIGINCNSFTDFAISNCQFDSLNGIGAYWLSTTVGSSRYGGRVINCLFNLNNVGWQSGASGEYVSVIGGVAKFNTKACVISGGNVVVSGMDIHDNGVGVNVIAGSNNGHGTISACKINHNSVYNVQIADDSLGMEFSGCQIFDTYIYVKNSTGISFVGCEIAPIAMYFENSKGTRFSSNVFYTGYGFNLFNNYNSTTSETFYNNNQYLGGASSGIFMGQDTTRSAINLLDILQSKNGSAIASITNVLGGTLANSQFQAVNDSLGAIGLQAIGAKFTPQTFTVPSSGRIVATTNLINGLYTGTQGTAPYVFGTNSIERMRLDGGGQLLVGTSTPSGSSKILVNGDVNATTFTAPTFIGGSTTTSSINFQTTTGTSATGANFNWLNGINGSNTLMTLLNSGFLGLGTTAPLNMIHLVGSVNGVMRVQIDNSSTGTGARAGVFFTQNGTNQAGNIEYLGSGFSLGAGFESFRASGVIMATGANAVGGLSFVTQNTTASITFTAGGLATAQERMRILPTGPIGIGTQTPASGLTVNTSFATAYRAITALRTLDATDYLINCTSNSFTVTLPTAVGIAGRHYIIKNTGSATTITVATTSSQTIDGSAPGTITNLTPLRVFSDGANWITF